MTDAQKKRVMSRQPGKIICQGCGEEIHPDTDDLSKVEYVKTKRGSEWFFHHSCMDKVWRRKICWKG